MQPLFDLSQRIAAPFLRIAVGIVVLWIGALKFVDPAPVVGLLAASLPFLASDAVVHLLGAVEVVTAALVLANVGVRYVGFVLMALFAGTLTILVIAPAVSFGGAGFPRLSMAGQFLLKDLALFAASVTLVAIDAARAPAPAAVRALATKAAA